jgi:long-chain acyl-CoA synthetase
VADDETTTNLFGSVAKASIDHTDQTEVVAADPGPTPALVEEGLRSDAWNAYPRGRNGRKRMAGFFVGELLEEAARRQPQRDALIAGKVRFTWAELAERTRQLARHLELEKVAAGDRVGLLLPNSAAFALGYYATQAIGAVTTVLDVRLRGRELERIIRDADLRLLVTHADLLPNIRDVLDQSGDLPLWIVEGAGDERFERRLEGPAPPLPAPRIRDDDDAVILYTSGTTGEPKGVVLTPENLAQFPNCIVECFQTTESEVVGLILPMSHISGPIWLNEVAARGSALVVIEQFSPVALLRGIQQYGITLFHGVPVLFQLVLDVLARRRFDTDSVRMVAMMGSTVPLPLLRAYREAQPHSVVTQGYGLTETSPIITMLDEAHASEKMGSIGRPASGAEVKLVDDSGAEVPEGEVGEIATRGPHVMKGYFRKPEATAERIRDGWLFTGDVARRDEDGFYYHLGRKDDLIISGGLNVYPAEIESALSERADVQEAAAYAIPDAMRGEVVGVAVVPRGDTNPSERELLEFLRSNLASYKVPREIQLRESLPRNPTGKIMREALLQAREDAD